MDKITYLSGLTKTEVPVEKVLNGAIEQNLQSVIVIGEGQNGKEYFAASDPDNRHNGWLADRFKRYLLNSEGD